MPWKTVRVVTAESEATFCWWCGARIAQGGEVHILVPTDAELGERLPELCSPGCAARYADWVPPEVLVAAGELSRLVEAGATLGDVLDGEAGRRWIEDACAGDVEMAQAAFRLVYPEASFAPDPLGGPGDVVVVLGSSHD